MIPATCRCSTVMLNCIYPTNEGEKGGNKMAILETEKRLKRCCFTGHRPEKLGVSENFICQKIDMAVDLALGKGILTFICGMARGVDLWAGEIVLQKKKSCPEINLVCATPFIGFERRWNSHWQALYSLIASHADYKVAISSQYDRGCFQRRNEWMVAHSGLVIAAYNGESGGTRNTIAYARQCGIPVHNVLDHAIDP